MVLQDDVRSLIKSWTSAGMGGGGASARPCKCCKVLFVLQMLYRVSVDDVFMHF